MNPPYFALFVKKSCLCAQTIVILQRKKKYRVTKRTDYDFIIYDNIGYCSMCHRGLQDQ